MADKPDKALKNHYEGLSREELARQGREHLAGDARPKVQRLGRALGILRAVLVLALIIGLGTVAVRMLFKAKDTSAGFARDRDERLHRIAPTDE